jgi:hypothetical protein
MPSGQIDPVTHRDSSWAGPPGVLPRMKQLAVSARIMGPEDLAPGTMPEEGLEPPTRGF